MKLFVKSLLVAAIGASALVAQAQPAPKIATIDLIKVYKSHHETEEHENRLKRDQDSANQQLERIVKEGQGLAEEFKSIKEQSENAALTAEARQRATEDANQKLQQIQQKRQEMDNFRATIGNSLQNRARQFNETLFDKISTLATEIAKKKGANLLIDKSAPTVAGFNRVIYADAGFDITQEVIDEIAKTRPAGTPAPTPGAKANTPSSAPAAGDAPPAITLPGKK